MEPQTFVFFGIVGSGKGTQVKLLREFLKSKFGEEAAYIGTGEIFRKILASSPENPDTEMIKEILKSGRLVPDEITDKVVASAIDNISSNQNVIFDGYPRTVNQSKFFENLMGSTKRGNVKIIYIELGEAEAMKRNLLRGRHDDTEEGLKQRFEEYRTNVTPAMSYFKDKENYEIYTINGEQSVEDVHKDIIKSLNF